MHILCISTKAYSIHTNKHCLHSNLLHHIILIRSLWFFHIFELQMAILSIEIEHYLLWVRSYFILYVFALFAYMFRYVFCFQFCWFQFHFGAYDSRNRYGFHCRQITFKLLVHCIQFNRMKKKKKKSVNKIQIYYRNTMQIKNQSK